MKFVDNSMFCDAIDVNFFRIYLTRYEKNHKKHQFKSAVTRSKFYIYYLELLHFKKWYLKIKKTANIFFLL